MEPWFLNYIILISPGKNKKRTPVHSNDIYLKDIVMLDLMESIKLCSPLKRMLNEFFQTYIFFSTQNNLADYLNISMKNIPSCNSSEWPAPSKSHDEYEHLYINSSAAECCSSHQFLGGGLAAKAAVRWDVYWMSSTSCTAWWLDCWIINISSCEKGKLAGWTLIQQDIFIASTEIGV